MEILVPALILCVDNILENIAAVKLLAGPVAQIILEY